MSNVSNKADVSVIAQGSTRFGFDLFNKVIKPEENAVFSSYSVSCVLSMASMGAKGTTLEEMRKVLHLPEDLNVLKKAYESISSLLAADKDIQLEIANGLFPANSGLSLHEDYVNECLKIFSSDIKQIDFGVAETAAKDLNTWVSTKTHDKIQDLFNKESIDPDTVCVLINAIYFKGNWMDKFDPLATSDKPFHVSPNKTHEVPTMYAEMDLVTQYNEDLQCDIVALPYKGDRITMYILLPKEQFGLGALEAKLPDYDMTSFLDKMTDTKKVALSLPKFKLESKHDIKDGLLKQGVKELFSRSCDLSGVGGAPGDICVSDAIQKAVIEVNEVGSEASAATGVTMIPCCLVIAEPMTVNHPFAFLIRDKLTEVTLFSGRVVDPLF